MQKLTNKGIKLNNLDDVQFLSAKVPGPGGYNPHVQIYFNIETYSEIED